MKNQYFTEIKIEDFGWRMTYQDQLMLMGSCFAENIGEKLQRLKFNTDLNPFGIIYNPMSVAKSIKILLSDKTYQQDDLFEHKGIWGSFDHHGRFSSTSFEETLLRINQQLEHSRNTIKNAGYLVVTFGTSWVYELKSTGEVVSNCHKFPATDFNRVRLTTEEIVDEYIDLLKSLWAINKELKVLFTVSPIRHWKDGASGNQLSKATLLLAVDQIINEFGNERCAYFPSYEIVMDELRDYRFYAPDMLHISQVAVDHIWNKFSDSLISGDSLKLTKSILKIMKAVDHRPFYSDSDEYRKFILSNLETIKELTQQHPYVNLKSEKQHFESELISTH